MRLRRLPARPKAKFASDLPGYLRAARGSTMGFPPRRLGVRATEPRWATN